MICKLCNKKINQLQSRNRQRCNSCNTRIRRYRTKKKLVEIMGGKCQRCSWRGNISAFEFHHKNKNKEFNLGSCANKKWEILLEEALKCELLCSNCHRIEHGYDENDKLFMDEVSLYKGRFLGTLA